MADYYSKLCFAVSWPAEAIAWAKQLDDAVSALEGLMPLPADGDSRAALIEETLEDCDPDIRTAAAEVYANDCGTGCTLTEDGGAFIIATDESANIDELISFLQAVIARFDLEPVGFEWSNDASRPLIDAYGGGAAFVSKDDVELVGTGRWLAERQSDWAVKRAHQEGGPKP